MKEPSLYSERLIRALEAAAQLHATQRRKGTQIPYLSHLLGTCAIALEYGAAEDEAIAALLHDAIEDVTPTEQARAAVAEFGERVLRIVEACTDTDEHPQATLAPAQGGLPGAPGGGRCIGPARVSRRQAAQRAVGGGGPADHR
jgi:(p)ppGpp synthase/HD superfamily hydrolase